MNKTICTLVRDSCSQWMVSKGGDYIKIHPDAVALVAQRIEQQSQIVWDEEDWHYQPPKSWPNAVRKERIALYILALDAINFCFWPSNDEKYEYPDLACTLTSIASADHEQRESIFDRSEVEEQEDSFLLSAFRMQHLSVEEMQQLFAKHHKDGKSPPDMDRRCALWNELGQVLCNQYQGSALSLVESANGSAVQLVQTLFDQFPGFRDVVTLPEHTFYFMKRAQICVGDLQAALPMDFHDMDELTTFPDYRLPQLLRHWNVLEYVQDDLRQAVDGQQELHAGGEAEVSIRAATVVVVEQLVRELQAREKLDPPGNGNGNKTKSKWNAVQVDWYLWQVGERMDGAGELKPHHRVRTIFY